MWELEIKLIDKASKEVTEVIKYSALSRMDVESKMLSYIDGETNTYPYGHLTHPTYGWFFLDPTGLYMLHQNEMMRAELLGSQGDRGSF